MLTSTSDSGAQSDLMDSSIRDIVRIETEDLASDNLLAKLETLTLPELMEMAQTLRDAGYANVMTYSPKVFLPLTRLCRDVCHYCTFAKTPKQISSPYLSIDEMVNVATAGAANGCGEALFTLGDQPERRYRQAREALHRMGHDSTLSYLAEAAGEVYERSGLFPHLNPGVMGRYELEQLREVSVSCGLMLESTSVRLCNKGGPHYGSPDKHPHVRLRTIEHAGALKIPFTSGILVGIGETRQERIESLLALRALHRKYGHIQEVIIQNFCAKPGTPMGAQDSLPLEEHLRTIACARLIFGADMSIQAPPNLQAGALHDLVNAGINDWGGISPLTPDYVNPEAPWPTLDVLQRVCAGSGKALVPRLPVYPAYIADRKHWVDPVFHPALLQRTDSVGLLRDCDWVAGSRHSAPPQAADLSGAPAFYGSGFQALISRALDGKELDESAVARLFTARGRDFDETVAAADRLRFEVNGDPVSYVINRNINYTNICYFKCGFCAFSKAAGKGDLRGEPYDLAIAEVVDRAREAWARGATEVCMQGGIHPSYTGRHYVELCGAVKKALPEVHIHAFSPLEILQGANSVGVGVEDFLRELKLNGLNTLPGTAAEILDDEIRESICPDKLNTRQWLDVVETGHSLGIRSTSTIMFGHVDGPLNWARHLLALRALQRNTGGITEFVPLPFVADKTPLYRKGRARRGPTFREALLMHAVARLVLHPHITNIQTSWVKMGAAGAAACLRAGANDLGGTLMNESISRAAGADHAQQMSPKELISIAAGLGREARQRNTLYDWIGSRRSPQNDLLNAMHA